MIELKKFELNPTLLQISTYKTNDDGTSTPISGLLFENLPLREKRKLQKIHKKTYTEFQEFIKDHNELKEKLKDSPEELEKEMFILINEVVKIDLDKVSLSVIEEISSSTAYNFDLIEKIAE